MKPNRFGSCPYVTMQKIFSGKWSLLIIHLLRTKKLRFGELQRGLGDLTQATLTKQLRYLEKYGLIHREVYSTIPPKVEYSLTDIGKEFLPVIEALGEFGKSYIAARKDVKLEHP
jgi:DNA-binding HxlR family transcriptional regulator